MNLQKLLTLRSGHRNVITRQLEKIEEAKKDPTLTDFHTILETIQQKARAIEPLNEKILSLTDINDIEEELMNSEEYSLDLEIKLKHLKIFGNKQSRNDVENSNSRDDSTMHGNSGNTRDDLLSTNSFQRTASFASSNSQFYRLPKLTIPTFNGDILKWQTFWDSYESTVHTNINLTDVQKFSYLQSQLDGDAARTIEGFPLSNANYAKAVQLLIERFGQPHKITHAYMQSLIQLQAPSSNINSLRNFYDKMEAYIRGLECLGKNQDSFGSMLAPVILDKLPADVRRQLARERSDGNWNLQDLRAAIFREINIMEAGNAQEFSSEKLAKDLHLIPDGTDVVTLATFGNTKKNTRSLDTATVYVKTEHGTKIPITVLIVPMIATPLNNRYRENVMNMPYLKKLKFAHPVSSDDNFEISLLIGADFYWSFIQDNIIRGNGPTAVQSRLGYLLSGPLPHCNTVTPHEHVQTVIATHIQGEDESALEKFWSLESMGISNSVDKPETIKLTEYQHNAIYFSDGRYIAKLPWKSDHHILPSNYNVTKRRTESMLYRLRKEPELLNKYGEIINEQEKRGFIEKVPDEANPNQLVHYIPHHPVKKDSSTTPVRIVYDCSCRENQENQA